jgi:hypothetical protein
LRCYLSHSRYPTAKVEKDAVIDYPSLSVAKQKRVERCEQYEGRAG